MILLTGPTLNMKLAERAVTFLFKHLAANLWFSSHLNSGLQSGAMGSCAIGKSLEMVLIGCYNRAIKLTRSRRKSLIGK